MHIFNFHLGLFELWGFLLKYSGQPVFSSNSLRVKPLADNSLCKSDPSPQEESLEEDIFHFLTGAYLMIRGKALSRSIWCSLRQEEQGGISLFQFSHDPRSCTSVQVNTCIKAAAQSVLQITLFRGSAWLLALSCTPSNWHSCPMLENKLGNYSH